LQEGQENLDRTEAEKDVGSRGGFFDRTEAKRRTTAAGSPMGERSESINKIFEIKGIDRRGEGYWGLKLSSSAT
jgi:hypothetical protein